MAKKWYMWVTNDEYSLPITPPMRLGEMSVALNTDKSGVWKRTIDDCHGKYEADGVKWRKRIIVRFESSELDELERQERKKINGKIKNR